MCHRVPPLPPFSCCAALTHDDDGDVTHDLAPLPPNAAVHRGCHGGGPRPGVPGNPTAVAALRSAAATPRRPRSVPSHPPVPTALGVVQAPQRGRGLGPVVRQLVDEGAVEALLADVAERGALQQLQSGSRRLRHAHGRRGEPGMHWKREGGDPLWDIQSGCCCFTGPWTVTRSCAPPGRPAYAQSTTLLHHLITPPYYTTLLHHPITPPYYTTLLHHLITPPYYTTLLHHLITPPYYTTLLHHLITPPYYTTLLHHPITPPYYTTLLHHPITPPYYTTLLHHLITPPYYTTPLHHPMSR